MINSANIYNAISTTATDADGAPQFNYPATPTYLNEPCTIQGQASQVEGDQRRITQITSYLIIFGRMLNVSPRDKLTYIDVVGTMRTLFLESIEDMAGRGGEFTVYATERI